MVDLEGKVMIYNTYEELKHRLGVSEHWKITGFIIPMRN